MFHIQKGKKKRFFNFFRPTFLISQYFSFYENADHSQDQVGASTLIDKGCQILPRIFLCGSTNVTS